MTEQASTSILCGMSRRRLAFRPPKPAKVEPKPVDKASKLSAEAATKASAQDISCTSPKPLPPTLASAKKAQKRLASSWTPEEQVVFFDGVKQALPLG